MREPDDRARLVCRGPEPKDQGETDRGTIQGLRDQGETDRGTIQGLRDQGETDRGTIQGLRDQGETDRGTIQGLRDQSETDSVFIEQLEAEGVIDRATIANLEAAVLTARRIGVAMGMLMSARQLSNHEAFHVLRRASQDQNRKLRDIAENVIETGTFPEV